MKFIQKIYLSFRIKANITIFFLFKASTFKTSTLQTQRQTNLTTKYQERKAKARKNNIKQMKN
jgi:hypothetical protein